MSTTKIKSKQIEGLIIEAPALNQIPLNGIAVYDTVNQNFDKSSGLITNRKDLIYAVVLDESDPQNYICSAAGTVEVRLETYAEKGQFLVSGKGSMGCPLADFALSPDTSYLYAGIAAQDGNPGDLIQAFIFNGFYHNV